MDKLEELYKIQEKFTKDLFEKKFDIKRFEEIYSNSKERVKWNKEYIISIHSKAAEFLEQMNWKMHLNREELDVKDNYLDCGIDMMKYLFGLLIINGFSFDDIYQKFKDKSKVVDDKVKTQAAIKNIKNESYRKIAFVDIDGVIANWTDEYIDFVNERYKTNWQTLPEAEQFAINKETKYITKMLFRTSGKKQDLRLIDDARLFLDKLKDNNYYIVLITARPYKEVSRLYYDTLTWLEKNELYYDTIIWDEQKEKYIINNFFNTKLHSFIIDDDIDNCNKVAKQGFITFYKFNENSYSKETSYEDIIKKLDKKIIPIKNLSEMIERLNLK